MPRISFFYGLAIWMYWNEGAHARPHFHARYAGQTASLDFAGELIAGSLPRRALALVAEWARPSQLGVRGVDRRYKVRILFEPIEQLAKAGRHRGTSAGRNAGRCVLYRGLLDR